MQRTAGSGGFPPAWTTLAATPETAVREYTEKNAAIPQRASQNLSIRHSASLVHSGTGLNRPKCCPRRMGPWRASRSALCCLEHAQTQVPGLPELVGPRWLHPHPFGPRPVIPSSEDPTWQEALPRDARCCLATSLRKGSPGSSTHSDSGSVAPYLRSQPPPMTFCTPEVGAEVIMRTSGAVLRAYPHCFHSLREPNSLICILMAYLEQHTKQAN